MPKHKSSFLFHPFEVAFCGYSNSGKTTLINKLIHNLKADYDIGYVKHDAHKFEMDKEGKDTFRAWESGASQIFISDSTHTASISKGTPDLVEMKSTLLKKDIVLIEGYKGSPAAKIVVLDKDEEIMSAVSEGVIDNIISFVGPSDKRPKSLPAEIPFFQRDDTEGISTFLKDYLLKKAMAVPVFGLVLAGGHSTRMKTDKALLNYSGSSQAETCYRLLDSFCHDTFISSRMNQWQDGALSHLPQLLDSFSDQGPLGGILTAMQKYPQAAWLVVACDLPFLEESTLSHLIKNRNPFKMVTCFQSETDDLPEPLCSIYEPKSYMRLLQFLGLGYRCPRKVLIHSPIKLLKQTKANSLDNINTKEEYNKVKEGLHL